MIYTDEKPAVLLFQDGTSLEGIGIGAPDTVMGEITFSAIPGSGYTEILTDPTFKDQIILFTYPSIGNYGVPGKIKDPNGILKHFESDMIQAKGLVMNEYCQNPSHYEMEKTLDDWLIEEKIPGIQWIDTRKLTQKLVEKGSQIALLHVGKVGETLDLAALKLKLSEFEDPRNELLVDQVSVSEPKIFPVDNSIGKVVIVDLGLKRGIIRTLLSKKLEVVVVPYTHSYEQIMDYHPDGVVLSNGPGNPQLHETTITLAQTLIENSIPALGIGKGNLILGLAAGFDCYKMTAEHRGGRTTVETETGHCYITFQNHAYCLKNVNNSGFKQLYHDKDDESNEGLIHEEKPIFSVAFNPEGSPGPVDVKDMIFDKFIKMMEVN